MSIFQKHEKKTTAQIIQEAQEEASHKTLNPFVAKHEKPTIQQYLHEQRMHSPQPTLKERAKTQAEREASARLEEQNASSRKEAETTKNPAVLKTLSGSHDVGTRVAVGYNKYATVDVQERLSKDDFDPVRMAVARTTNDKRILKNLSDPRHEKDEDVRHEAENRLAFLSED